MCIKHLKQMIKGESIGTGHKHSRNLMVLVLSLVTVHVIAVVLFVLIK